ncbi:MAG: HIT family protein [Bacteroidales bacterium]|nr:HIT family protein [Bacteroidales bacterium]
MNRNWKNISKSLAYLILDHYPVARFHSLVIPKRHFSDYFEITQPELNAVNQLLIFGKEYLINNDRTIKGFNIGVNSGIVAGQTIMHCHTHLIPRKDKDVEDPRGGIRHVIPGMGYY